MSKCIEGTTKLPCYFFASSKAWHWDNFNKLKAECAADWVWVSKREELDQAYSAKMPRYIFFLHWNWRVPTEIWTQHECVCFHMTDVPYGRGGSPLQNLIQAGHKETKLTALRMVEGMDAGPVYAKRPLSLAGRAEEIYRRAGDLSIDVIRWMLENQPTPTPQTGDVTIFKRRKPEQSALPRNGSLESLSDHIRMLDAPSYPYAFVEYGDYRLEFSHAQMEEGELIARVTIRRDQLADTDL